MLHAVEVLVEDVYVERLELGLEHVVVVADADGAERVQRVLLHQHVVVHHEVERRLEHLVHRVTAVLKDGWANESPNKCGHYHHKLHRWDVWSTVLSSKF